MEKELEKLFKDKPVEISIAQAAQNIYFPTNLPYDKWFFSRSLYLVVVNQENGLFIHKSPKDLRAIENLRGNFDDGIFFIKRSSQGFSILRIFLPKGQLLDRYFLYDDINYQYIHDAKIFNI